VIFWQTTPTVDELEDFLGADEVTAWNVGSALLVVLVSILLAGLARRLIKWLLRKVPQLREGIPDLVGRATGWFIILGGSVVALTVLGIEMLPALMMFLVFGVVFFVVGKGLLSNFSAGLVIQGTPMFFVGDQVETSAGTGTITFITGRTVVIRTEDGTEIHVPNRLIINDPVINLTHLGSRRFTLAVGVEYGTDLDSAKQLIESTVDGCEATHADPPAEALVAAFGANAVRFDVHFWHEPTIIDGMRSVDSVARAIASAFAEHGVVIALPQRVLHFDGDAAAKPSSS
jgi:small-conductance mechanosensitive channel